MGRYTWLANEVLKSILYRYKNTGLLGHLFQDPIISFAKYRLCQPRPNKEMLKKTSLHKDYWLEIAIAYRRYLFFILGRRPRSLSDSDKEAALYLAADKESLFIKKS